MGEVNPSGPAKPARTLTVRQDLIFRLFANIIGKQEIGKVNAALVEQFLTVADQAADHILQSKL